MGRKLRLEYEGAIYHLMSRGDRREPIFMEDADRTLFLETLGQVCAKTDWLVHAYCLMPNHFHLVVETPKANLVTGMKWFLGNYTNRFNRKHKLFGHVFSGRYKSLIVDGSTTGYLRTVCDYVHLNPVRAKLVRREQKLGSYPWSSYREYLRAPGKRPAWLRVGRVLGEMGIPKDSPAGRKEFGLRMELRRREDEPAEWKRLRRGWCLGDKQFRKELLAEMGDRLGAEHYGEERRETAEAKAERILQEEMKRRKWSAATLAQKRKGDPGKVKIAQRLRAETTMTLEWIAERLQMGTKTHLVHLLYWQGRKKGKQK